MSERAFRPVETFPAGAACDTQEEPKRQTKAAQLENIKQGMQPLIIEAVRFP